MHDIEGGDQITDHIIKRGVQLTLNGLISEDAYLDTNRLISIEEDQTGPEVWTGERLQRIGSGAFSGIAGSLVGGGVPGAAVTYGYSKLAGSILQKPSQPGVQTAPPQDTSPIKVKSAYQMFEQIYENRLPVTIITGLDAYPNMVMESLSMPRNQGTTRSLPFTASFRRVNFVWSNTVTIPAMADRATADRGTPKQNQGNKQSTVITEESNASLLYRSWGIGKK